MAWRRMIDQPVHLTWEIKAAKHLTATVRGALSRRPARPRLPADKPTLDQVAARTATLSAVCRPRGPNAYAHVFLPQTLTGPAWYVLRPRLP